MTKGFATLLTGLVAVSASTLINTSPVSAQGATNVSELTDVVGNEWAYNALKELVNNPCHVLVGYPDRTFRGQKSATRFELAAALYKYEQCITERLATKADKADLEKFAALLDEFRGELNALKARVDSLEARMKLVEDKNIEQDMRLAYAERQKGFIYERLVKGTFIDGRDIVVGAYRGIRGIYEYLF
ncbi:MAG: S-layer homology domain-containing protein [Candidatus Melainabacteria bacterium]|nr:S-layer homology domain-containing protein [Candidatus Melainabacteria bacterium]